MMDALAMWIGYGVMWCGLICGLAWFVTRCIEFYLKHAKVQMRFLQWVLDRAKQRARAQQGQEE